MGGMIKNLMKNIWKNWRGIGIGERTIGKKGRRNIWRNWKKVWNGIRKMSKGVRGSGGTKKKFLWKQNLKRGYCYGTLWTLTFFFFFYLFFLILYFFSFEFLFLFLFSFFFLVMMKRHVTLQSHNMSHDVMS